MYVFQKLQREKGMVQGTAQCIQKFSNCKNFRGKSTREISPTARKLVKVNEYKIHPGKYFNYACMQHTQLNYCLQSRPGDPDIVRMCVR